MSGLLELVRCTLIIHTDLSSEGTHQKLQVPVSQNQDLRKDVWSVTVMEMVYERKPLLSLETGQLWREAKNPKRQSKGQAGNINFFMVHLHTMHFSACPPFCYLGWCVQSSSAILLLSSLNLEASGIPLSSLPPYSPASLWLFAYLHSQFHGGG